MHRPVLLVVVLVVGRGDERVRVLDRALVHVHVRFRVRYLVVNVLVVEGVPYSLGRLRRRRGWGIGIAIWLLVWKGVG